MGLGAPDDDAVLPLFHHMDEHVRIHLLARTQAAVALDVGHGAGHHPVIVLDLDEELLEPLVVIGAQRLIALVGNGVGGVHGVEAHAALIAGTGLLGDGTQHLGLFHQVIHRLVDVGETVDLMTGEVGGGGHEILVLRVARQGVGHGGGVHMAPDEGMIDDGGAVQQLALHIDADLPLAEAVFVFFCSLHSRCPLYQDSEIASHRQACPAGS